MSTRTFPYDTAEFLGSDEEIAFYAEAVLEENDPAMFRRALDVVARAHGFARLADQAGLSRPKLMAALRHPENDAFGTLKTVLECASARMSHEAAE